MKLNFISLSSVLVLAGCAATYKPPTGGETATLVIQAPQEEMFGLGQNMSLVSGEQCTNPQVLAGFHPLSSERVARQTVPAGTRLYVKAGLSNSRAYPRMRMCTNLISFVPVAGASYTLKQLMVGESCLLDLRQEADQKLPATILVHPAKPCL